MKQHHPLQGMALFIGKSYGSAISAIILFFPITHHFLAFRDYAMGKL